MIVFVDRYHKKSVKFYPTFDWQTSMSKLSATFLFMTTDSLYALETFSTKSALKHAMQLIQKLTNNISNALSLLLLEISRKIFWRVPLKNDTEWFIRNLIFTIIQIKFQNWLYQSNKYHTSFHLKYWSYFSGLSWGFVEE